MNKLLIFGNGYVGNKLKDALPGAVITNARIHDLEAVQAALDECKPDIVINCAGKTGKPNVDWCEDHKLETVQSNITGALLLAQECVKRNIYFVHIGSGCVYQGDNNGKGFSEEDPPNYFGSFYSMTKAVSEAALKELPVLQLRSRMPIDEFPGPRNLITKITSYKRVISTSNSISIMSDFVTAARELIKKRKTGIYNVTNPEGLTHAEMLDMYRDLVDPTFTYELMTVEELSKITKAGRSSCVLNTDKLAAEGIILPPIKEALRRTLIEYKKNMNSMKYD